MTVRRAALIAAVMLGVVRAYWIYNLIRGLFGMPDLRWASANLINIASLLPLPVLLVILHRTDATLTLSRKFRRLALATAVVYGTLFAIPQAYSWIRLMTWDWPDVTWSEGGFAVHQILAWIRTLNASTLLESRVWLADVAFILLLIALFRHRDEAPEAGPHRSSLLRYTAAVATIAAGLVLIAGTGWQLYAIVDPNKHYAPRGQLFVSTAERAIEQLCYLLVAYTVYRMQPQASAEPVAVPGP